MSLSKSEPQLVAKKDERVENNLSPLIQCPGDMCVCHPSSSSPLRVRDQWQCWSTDGGPSDLNVGESR